MSKWGVIGLYVLAGVLGTVMGNRMPLPAPDRFFWCFWVGHHIAELALVRRCTCGHSKAVHGPPVELCQLCACLDYEPGVVT